MRDEKKLSVAAIEKGTVIDHIDVGGALKIMKLLRIADSKLRITVGMNLPSQSMGFKDIIKIEGRNLTDDEIAKLALFASKATVNLIDNFKVVRKFKVEVPKEVGGWLACPNPTCITHAEEVGSRFFVSFGKKVELKCLFCEKKYSNDSF